MRDTYVQCQPAYQAYQILRVTFAAAPMIAGLDNFLHLLVNWDIALQNFGLLLGALALARLSQEFSA